MPQESQWPMRRKERQIPHDDAYKIAEKGEVGVLATAGSDGLPYAVPLSYVLMEDRLYFHCSNTGRKLHYLANQPQVCFVVVGHNEPVYLSDFTTLYESVIIEGQAALITNPEEKRTALMALCQKYLPQFIEKAPAYIQRSLSATTVVCISVQRLVGKSNR